MTGKKISWLALFIALSTVGAAIKIPAVIGSIALDVFPALLAAVLLGSGAGAIVGGLGHLLSALIGGMPLGPFHFMIATEMALLVWLFGRLYLSNKRIFASTSFLIGNVFLAPLPFVFLISKAFYVAIIPSLLIGSAVNIGLALVFIPRVAPIFKGQFVKEEQVK